MSNKVQEGSEPSGNSYHLTRGLQFGGARVGSIDLQSFVIEALGQPVFFEMKRRVGKQVVNGVDVLQLKRAGKRRWLLACSLIRSCRRHGGRRHEHIGGHHGRGQGRDRRGVGNAAYRRGASARCARDHGGRRVGGQRRC